MKTKNERGISFITVLAIAGAFISYTVGSGFASGNEVMQFFGSWGVPTCVVALAGAALVTLTSCVCLFRIGSSASFDTTSAAYRYVGGRFLGGFFQIFTFVSLFGTFMIMFSGAGSLFHQFWGLPQWVGAVLMGAVAGVVVIGGLKTVENVLGSAGIVILIYVLIFGAISLVYPGADISQADAIPQAVKGGVVYQANLLALPPLSYIPGLQNLNGPFLEGMLYAALCMVNGVPFFLTLGKRVHTLGQSVFSAVVTTIAFYACTALVMIIILMNFGVMIDPVTNKMEAFPVLSAVDRIWPAGSWTYVIIIFVGIFTTTTGFLWVLSEWLFPGQVRTRKVNLFVVGMIVFGICLGSVLPFSELINFIFPVSGLVGILITVCLVMRTVSLEKTASLQRNEPGEKS